jgi:hypothetical protein
VRRRLPAPVLPHGRLVTAFDGGPLLAVAHRRELRFGHALQHERAPDCLGAPLTQADVVLARAALVGMAFQPRSSRRVLHQVGRVRGHDVDVFRPDLAAVVGKVDRAFLLEVGKRLLLRQSACHAPAAADSVPSPLVVAPDSVVAAGPWSSGLVCVGFWQAPGWARPQRQHVHGLHEDRAPCIWRLFTATHTCVHQRARNGDRTVRAHRPVELSRC